MAYPSYKKMIVKVRCLKSTKLQGFFVSSYHFLDDDDETLHYLHKNYRLWMIINFVDSKNWLANWKSRVCFFDFLMKLDEGFRHLFDLDSWLFCGMMDSHLFCDMFAKECLWECRPIDSTIRLLLCPSFFFVFRVFITWRDQPLGRRYLHTWSGLSLGDTRVR